MRSRFLGLLIFISLSGFSQKVETDISACKTVLEVLESMRSGKAKAEVEKQLSNMLSTKAYQTMFRHYNRSWRPNHLPEDVFKRMILSLKFPEEYKMGENQRADAMLVFWKKNYECLDKFKSDIELLSRINLTALIQQGVSDAQKWLPKSMKIPDFYFFIHPNGGSTAFAINGSQGYDFFQLDRDKNGDIDVQKLVDAISHESHHLGLEPKATAFINAKDSLAYNFLMTFVAEGTASKFVDNMPGGFIPKVSKGRTKNFDSTITNIWDSYTKTEKELFSQFEADFQKIYSGVFNSDSIQARRANYWLSGQKGRAYFIGAELFGAIYSAFGKKTMFSVMEEPKLVLKYYNRAIQKLTKKHTGLIMLNEWLTNILEISNL